jgi:lipoate-protein ligase A
MKGNQHNLEKDRTFRVIDTGGLTAAENMALDSIILELREENLVPNTIRFLSFQPHSALVGQFQSVEKEIRAGFCKDNGIEINRRVTGGGALYWDTKDVGWEIFASKNGVFKNGRIEDFYKIFCSAASNGINRFGVKSKFRPRNDIELNGRKISGSGGTSIKDAFMFQGTLLVDLNIDMMLRALRIPVEKLKYKEINSLKERITWLSRELGYCPSRKEIISKLLAGITEALELEFFWSGLTELENKRLSEKLPYFKSPSHINRIRDKKSQYFLTSFSKSRKKTIKCSADIDIKRKIIRSVYFSGDFFLYPERFLNDLESNLKNIPADKEIFKKKLRQFFREYPVKIEGIKEADITKAVDTCIDKIIFKKYGIPLKYFNDIFLVNSSFSSKNKIEAFLLPYCAKMPGCKFRKKDGCSICEKCSTGDAVKIAGKYNIKTLTVVSYENLRDTLNVLKKRGVKYFGGSCCEAFYIKHKEDFERIGLEGILINIENKTCYDLGRESEAHEGSFEGFTDLKLDLLEKLFKILT